MRKIKLLLVADTYYPKVDGTLRFMEEFLKRAENNFEISLLVPDLGVHQGKKVQYLQTSKILSLSGYKSMKLSWKNFRTIKTAVQEAEIIFVQGPAIISFLSLYYGRKYHKRTFFYVHVIPWELYAKFVPAFFQPAAQWLVKKITVFFFSRCDHIIVPYHHLQQELREKKVKATISIARLGVDINLFAPAKDKGFYKRKLGIDENKKVIGYVGRISKEKNIKILLEGFKKLRHQEKLVLLLVGDGTAEQLKEVESLYNCMVTKFVESTKVAEYLKALDIFVMPSLTETTSLATLEAMSSGLPVIATKVGYIQRYIAKDYNGIFFPRKSSTLLAAKIEKILADRVLQEKLGGNARKTIVYSFSWERSINKIKRILLT